jgi:tetratricopeptide (TPR) repeat protein
VLRMGTGPARAVELARELEAQLDQYPDERGQILTEAAEYWHRAGDHDRAIELLTDAVSLGGEDGGNARVTLAEVLFDLGRAEEGRAQLGVLRQQRPSSPMPYHLAAELLEERGEHQQALTWFNMAISRLSDEELGDLHHEFGFPSYAGHLLAGRRRVRRAVGLPPDELDDSVPEINPARFGSIDDLAERLAHGARPPRELRVLFWPRTEIAAAHQRWPQLVEHADIDAIIRDREIANRDLSAAGMARITMVPLTTAKLAEFAARTGGDPADEQTRRACMDEIFDEGDVITWPPARNAPCWCGSQVKYKKCCGRPNPP